MVQIIIKNMKLFPFSLVAIFTLTTGSLLSHGYNDNCSQECNDYYCPSENQIEKKEKVKNNIPLKK